MRVEHLAIWVDDLEMMRQFYMKYFNLESNEKYTNVKNNYTSYFLSFGEGKTRIELMNRPDIDPMLSRRGHSKGFAHIAISVGSKEAVDSLINRFRNDGITIASETRTSGDGYYEGAILDPEGNYVEIMA